MAEMGSGVARTLGRGGVPSDVDGRVDRAGLAQLRGSLVAIVQELRQLPGVLWQAGGEQLGHLLGELDQVAALTAAGRVAVTAEAVQRGEVAASQCAGTAAWVAAHAPSLAAGRGAGQVAKVVEALVTPTLAPVTDAVLAGDLPVPVALVVLSEFDKLASLVVPEAQPLVLQGLVAIGEQEGASEVRKLRHRLLAEHGAPGQLQRLQDLAARQVALSHPVPTDEAAWDYLLRVDAEGKAVLEAAIGPLSAPMHTDGVRDPRSAQLRRGQALLEVCRRVTAAATAAGRFGGQPQADSHRCAGGQPDSGDSVRVAPPWQPDPRAIAAALAGMGAGGARGSVIVTMPLTDLQQRVGAATVLGTLAGDTLLAPETARRLACDAQVIPMLLGSHSEVLDHGRAERLFTTAQARVVLLRDRHCSFPDCRTPAFWCQVHHVRHWLDGGLTDIDNAALLCGRHHTIVHRDRVTATVTPTAVHWDTTPGSYDRALARDHPEDPAA
ncbi:MAG: HNH endonuclease [Dermatophilaceae bacterium]